MSCRTTPQPQEIELKSLESFGSRLGVRVQVVPDGVDLIPPTERVQELGQKRKPSLEYIFTVIDGPEFEEDGVLLVDAATDSSFAGSYWE